MMSDFLAYFLTYLPTPVRFFLAKTFKFTIWCPILAKLPTYPKIGHHLWMSPKLYILYYQKCICELLDVARGFLLRNNLLLLERRREKIRTLSLFLVLVKWRLQKMMSAKKTASHPPKHNVTIERGQFVIEFDIEVCPKLIHYDVTKTVKSAGFTCV